MAKVPKEERMERVKEAAKLLDLTEYLERKPKALSGGQRQRVAMGRAIVRKPRAFLFDEPLSNLDARLREQMRSEIRKLHRDLGTTSVYVTHDQIEAMTMADRIVAMQSGVIQQVGTPLELYDDPANMFVAGFIGAPAMNFLSAESIAMPEGLQLRVGGQVLAILGAGAGPRPTGQLVAGVRPERVRLAPHGPIVGRVDLVEPTGLATVVHLDLGGQNLILFTTERPPLKAGESVRLAIDPADFRLFDPATGERLRIGSQP